MPFPSESRLFQGGLTTGPLTPGHRKWMLIPANDASALERHLKERKKTAPATFRETSGVLGLPPSAARVPVI